MYYINTGGSDHSIRYLPVSSAALSRAGRDASIQPTTVKLLFDVGVEFTTLLTLLDLPLNMVALLCFICSCFSLLLKHCLNISVIISKSGNWRCAYPTN